MIKAERTRNNRGKHLRESSIYWLMVASLAAIVSAPASAPAQVPGQAASAVTERLFASVNSSVCTISALASDGSFVSRGSGFILEDSGLLVTNAHVVAGLQKATARCGGQELDIRRIVRFDPDVDLAVGEIGSINVPGLELATEGAVRPGSQIYVFGSPYGLEGTMTPGLTSGKRTIDGRTYLQISAPIGAGNSGGPVTDERGNVLGIAVASLEMDGNINFAIPAAAIPGLPDVDMQPAELVAVNYNQSTAPPAPPRAPQQPQEPVMPVRPAAGEGTGSFRGNAFGAPCGEVAAMEYARRRPVIGSGQANISFNKWYSGPLELDVDILGTPAKVIYECDGRLGMTAGHYRIRGNQEGVEQIARFLRSKYGSGIEQQISESDARQRGCRWNGTIPGSRFYRPSQWTSWRIDDRFHIDMLTCGGRSKTTLLFYSDPVLVTTASETPAATEPQWGPRFRESDL
jgi:hypothetical protein